jgi:hypothetical protein
MAHSRIQNNVVFIVRDRRYECPSYGADFAAPQISFVHSSDVSVNDLESKRPAQHTNLVNRFHLVMVCQFLWPHRNDHCLFLWQFGSLFSDCWSCKRELNRGKLLHQIRTSNVQWLSLRTGHCLSCFTLHCTWFIFLESSFSFDSVSTSFSPIISTRYWRPSLSCYSFALIIESGYVASLKLRRCQCLTREAIHTFIS